MGLAGQPRCPGSVVPSGTYSSDSVQDACLLGATEQAAALTIPAPRLCLGFLSLTRHRVNDPHTAYPQVGEGGCVWGHWGPQRWLQLLSSRQQLEASTPQQTGAQRAQDCQPPPGPVNSAHLMHTYPWSAPSPRSSRLLASPQLAPLSLRVIHVREEAPDIWWAPLPLPSAGRPPHLFAGHVTLPLCKTGGGSHQACRADPCLLRKVTGVSSLLSILPEALGTYSPTPSS